MITATINLWTRSLKSDVTFKRVVVEVVSFFIAITGAFADASAQDVCVTGAGDSSWNGTYVFDAGLNRWQLSSNRIMYQEFGDLVFRQAVAFMGDNAYFGSFSGNPVGTTLSVGPIGTAPAPVISSGACPRSPNS
jgi:hypothetical protein